MADTNQVVLAYAKESTYGTNPGGTFDELAFTSESLDDNQTYTDSEQINGDRDLQDIFRTNRQAEGDINFEWLDDNVDDFVRGWMLQNSWNSDPVTSGQIDVTASSTQFEDSNQSLGFGNVTVGQWIVSSGFSNSGNNGAWRVTSVSAGGTAPDTITVDDPAGELVDETGSGDEDLDGQYLFAGNTVQSFTIEREYTDLSSIFDAFLGMVPNTFSTTVPNQGAINGTIGFLGQKGLNSGAEQKSSSNAASSAEVMQSVDHFLLEELHDSNVTKDAFIESADFTAENNLRPKTALGSEGPVNVGVGTINVSGNISMYFENGSNMNPRDILDAFRQDNEGSFAFKIEDGSGNGYIFDFPRIIYTANPVQAGGRDEFVFNQISWRAAEDSTTGSSIVITRF